MTKRNKITVLLSVLLSGIVITSGVGVMTNGFTNFDFGNIITNTTDNFEVEELHNIHFSQVKESVLSDGTIRKEVTFSLTPNNADTTNLNTTLLWDEESNDNYESDTWYEDKNILDYVTYELDGENKKLTFDCSGPFGTGMIFTLSAKNDPSVKASLKLNYKRREIKAANASLVSDGYVPDGSMRINANHAVYSIGSSGDRAPTDPFSLDVQYISGTDYSFDSLFSGIQTTGIYAQQFKYNGKDYTVASSVLSDMKENVNNYLLSLPSLEEDNIFETATFRNLLTYQYASHKTYQIVFSESTLNFSTFIEEYNKAVDNGYGYQVTVSLNDDVLLKKLLPIEITPDNITDINLSEEEIEF